MKTIIGIFYIYIISVLGANALAEDITSNAVRIYYNGDRSQAMSMFYEIYSNNNDNAEALYQISVHEFEDNKRDKEQFIQSLQQAAHLAFESGDDALGHYIQSQAADKTGNPELAINEIKSALEIEPRSVRYLRGAMLFLISKSKKLKSRKILLEALEYGDKGLASVDTDPKKYFTKGSLHFEIARWIPSYNAEFSNVQINHYKKAIELNEMSEIKLSYAWNNMSRELYKLKQCKEAKIAAEKALEISKYRYAYKNLENAKLCLADNN